MPTRKSYFPLIMWTKKRIHFTLGGHNGRDLKEVQEYSLKLNAWKLHSSLPEGVHASSGTILNDVLYNLGGNSSFSIICTNLNSVNSCWEVINLVN